MKKDKNYDEIFDEFYQESTEKTEPKLTPKEQMEYLITFLLKEEKELIQIYTSKTKKLNNEDELRGQMMEVKLLINTIKKLMKPPKPTDQLKTFIKKPPDDTNKINDPLDIVNAVSKYLPKHLSKP